MMKQRIEWHPFNYSAPGEVADAAPTRARLGAHVCQAATLQDGSIVLFWYVNGTRPSAYDGAPNYYAIINAPERP